MSELISKLFELFLPGLGKIILPNKNSLTSAFSGTGKSFLCLLITCSLTSIRESEAQTLIPNGGQDPFKVNIIPPSPEAAALGKYADIPVSLYSGTPEIVVPIYDLKERDLNLPISVSYHASGIKVADQASRVGSGFVLNAGGAVTRTVRGWPDEYTSHGFLNTVQNYQWEDFFTPPTSLGTVLDRYELMAGNCLDAEPDIFYFNFAGYTGSFMFNWDGQIEIESSNSLKITPLGMNIGESDFIDGFEIVAEDGTVFIFNVVETTTTTNSTGITPSCDFALSNPMTSTWYLKEMRGPDGFSWIRFDYESYSQTVKSWSTESKAHKYPNEASAQYSRNLTTTTVSGKQLKKITTSSGLVTVDFFNGDLRTDLGGTSYMLGKIQVRNNRNVVVKDYRFTHDYSIGRLTLKKITEWSSTGSSSMPPYEFSYYNGVLPDALSFNQDHWGYVGQNTASTLIPATNSWGGFQLSGANRNPHPTNVLTGMLREIRYPTGGRDVMDFEMHEYQGGPITIVKRELKFLSGASAPTDLVPGELESDQSDFVASGEQYYINGTASFGFSGPSGGTLAGVTLTLKEKVSGTVVFYWAPGGTVDQNGEATRKYIEQEVILTAGTEYSLITTAQVPPNLDNGLNGISGQVVWWKNISSTIPNANLGGGIRIREITRSFGNGAPDKVTKYDYTIFEDGIEKSSGALNGYVFKYEDFLPTWETHVNPVTGSGYDELVVHFYRHSQNRCIMGMTHGSHVGYRQVTVVYGKNGENGKTVYKYTSPYDVSDYVLPKVPYPPAWSRDYRRGLLLEQEDYDNAGGLVKKIINDYYYSEKVTGALKIGKAIVGAAQYDIYIPSLADYAIGAYNNFFGYSRLKQTTEQTFLKDPSGVTTLAFSNTHKFTYNEDPGHRQLISTVTTDSQEDSLFTWTIYPQDYPPGNAALDLMKEKHVVNRAVETINWKKSGDQKFLLSAIKTDFIVNFGKALPSVVKGAKVSEPFPVSDPLVASLLYEPRLQYLNYGQLGNPLEHALIDGQRTSYIWDEWGNLVLAKVDHSRSDQIYHTSFEETNNGVSYVHKKTGSRSKVINNTTYTLAFKTLLPVGQYVLSYWLKGTNTSDPWTYVETVVNNTQPVYSFTTRVLNGYLDEVRLYPVGALMTTFTHEPLVGITSVTDPANVTVYFDYDEFNRLKCKRDQDYNIIECYDYQYQQEVSFASLSAPTITSFSPAFGTEGAEIVIHGTHFSTSASENVVKFNGITASVISSTTTELMVTAPVGVTTGRVSVQVGGYEFTSDVDFTVPASITSFTPASGLPPAINAGLPGATITLTGTGFSTIPSENTVRFNSSDGQVTQASSTQLTVVVPQYAASGKIGITRNGVSTESQNSFTVLPRNVWQQVADFGNGLRRTRATGFAIGTKIYLGTGKNENGQEMNDFWEFNTEANTWTKKPDFPAGGRSGAIGFSIGSKGYIGLGTSSGTDLADVWEYDTDTDTWRQVTNFKGLARSGAIAYSMNGKGYVGTGTNSVSGMLADVWEYDPLINDWKQIQSLPAGRTDAYAFVIGSKAYIGGGRNKTLYQYDAVANTWLRKADCPYYAGMSAFTIGLKGYVQGLTEFWMYDASANQWIPKAPLPISVTFAEGFSIGNFGYAGTGTESGIKSFFKYIPD